MLFSQIFAIHLGKDINTLLIIEETKSANTQKIDHRSQITKK